MNKRITIRIPDDVYALLLARAKVEQRTISNLVIVLLKKELNGATNGAGHGDDGDSPHSSAA